MYAGGYAVWLAYGFSIGSLPLIVVDAIGLVCGHRDARDRWPARVARAAGDLEELPRLKNHPRGGEECRIAAWLV